VNCSDSLTPAHATSTNFFDNADDVAGFPDDIGNERVGQLRPPY
jgi:hypothetical protein